MNAGPASVSQSNVVVVVVVVVDDDGDEDGFGLFRRKAATC